MRDDDITGVEAFILGTVSRCQADAWVGRALGELIGSALSRILFRAGRIDAVYGVLADDGRNLVVKIHRPPVDLDARRTATRAQGVLAAAGFPCPTPVAGPTTVDGRVVSVETLLDRGTARTGREPAIRRATAAGLAAHMAILTTVPHLADSVGPPPAWCRYEDGPWPPPHDTVFDFTHTPAGFEWLDAYARRASEVLRRDRSRDDRAIVVGHADWSCGNLRFTGDQLVAAVDWDLIADSTPVIAGLSAGSYRADGVPRPKEVAAYLSDFEAAWMSSFSPEDWSVASAAASWILAFNARCDLANRERNVGDGAALTALQEHGEEYLRQLS